MSRKAIGLAVLAAGALLAAAPVQAQVPEQPGFFASGTALWMFNLGDTFSIPPFAVRPGNGPGFDLMLGYKFDSAFDVSLSGGLTFLRQKTSGNAIGQLSTFARHQHLDLELGYSIGLGPDAAMRIHGGVRGYHYNQNVGLEAFAPPATAGIYRNVWGVGPMLGIGARTNITQNIGLVGAVDGALLISGFRENAAGIAFNSYTRLVPQVGAEAGLQYRFDGVPSLAVTAGARIEATFNVASTINTATGAFSRGNLVEVGPFIRLSYNLHAPKGAPPPAPMPPVPPAASYMVFFDFDRSNITPTAAETIRKAAADAKAGQKTRIGVTGHADRAGSDAYNMALSLRRANAVKDALVRNGIPATAIAVVGRGESQPLVQTADGVREPQNRRVEIVLQ